MWWWSTRPSMPPRRSHRSARHQTNNPGHYGVAPRRPHHPSLPANLPLQQESKPSNEAVLAKFGSTCARRRCPCRGCGNECCGSRCSTGLRWEHGRCHKTPNLPDDNDECGTSDEGTVYSLYLRSRNGISPGICRAYMQTGCREIRLGFGLARYQRVCHERPPVAGCPSRSARRLNIFPT